VAILLLTDPQPSAPFREALARLAPGESILTDLETARARARDVEAIVLWRLEPGIASLFPRLKMLCASAGGVDKIMACTDRPAGLPVTRTIDADQNLQIAQFVAMMVLRHARRLALYEGQAQRKQWRRHPTPAASAITVGLLGLGASGQAVAAGLKALGMTVMGWSRTAREVPGVECHSGAQGLARMLPRSDVLVCLLPLTPQTSGLLGRDLFEQLPRGAFVVNVARGALLREHDLAAAVRSGQLAGAALDVQSREPLPPEDPLWDVPGVLVTPHIASLPAPDVVVAQVLENLARVRVGLAPLRQVDEQRGY
jgi:phosphoglycerate dehydrogenase-like enzyme